MLRIMSAAADERSRGEHRASLKFYCARGGMGSRIKEQQLDLFADRTSTTPMGVRDQCSWNTMGRCKVITPPGGKRQRRTVLTASALSKGHGLGFFA